MKTQDELLQIVLGSLMVQVSMYRFLLRENVMEKDKLLQFLAERAVSWEQNASSDAMFPLETVMAMLAAKEEPKIPTLH